MSAEDTQVAGQTLEGGVTGAAVGGQVGGGWGAVIGAIVGGVAGFGSGMLSRGHKKKAKRRLKQATALQRAREDEAYKQSLLSQIRNARIARASALASTVAARAEEGSGSQGALSSYGSQAANIVEYLSVDRGRAVKAADLTSKARKNLSVGQTIDNAWNSLLGAVQQGSKAYSASQGGSGDTGSTTTPSTDNYYFDADTGNLTLGEGSPYLQNGQVQYVKRGQTYTIKNS